MNNIYNKIVNILYKKENIWNLFVPNKDLIDHQGWNGDHPLLSIFNPIFKEQIIVDLGVWKGQSTKTLAYNLKNKNLDGVVIAIDTFLGSEEHHADTKLYPTEPCGRPNLYNVFLNNIFDKNLHNYVIPFAQTATTAFKVLYKLNIKPTFVHIDASHEYKDVLDDLSNYYSILQSGGVIVCDDYDHTWPGVVKAVDEFCFSNNLEKKLFPPKCLIIKP